MATRRETIIQAAVTALAGTTQVGDRIYRSRTQALQRGEAPALIIEPLNDNPVNDVLPKLDWTLQLQVAVFTRGTPADQLADPIVDEVHRKLIGNATLNGLINGIRPGQTSFMMVDADQDAGVTSLIFEVRYRTSFADLSLS
jgi:hypothetical protein